MYMNGRGPMGGRRGPGFGPGFRGSGFRPGMGFGPMDMHRPMRMYRRMGMHRPRGFFPLGGLFILPGLMFGGWIVLAVLSGILSLVGSIIGGVFEGLGALAEGAFSGSGLVLGIVIGLAAYFFFRKRNATNEAQNKSASTVDGTQVETQIVDEPVHYAHREY